MGHYLRKHWRENAVVSVALAIAVAAGILTSVRERALAACNASDGTQYEVEASCSAEPTEGCAPLEVTFSGSGSSEPSGYVGNEYWTRYAPTPSPNGTYTFTEPGTYTNWFVVEGQDHGDSENQVCIDSCKVVIVVQGIDLDMDSDHSADYDGGVERNDLEDRIEEGSSGGETLEEQEKYKRLKFVVFNDIYDEDTNGIPGYADGYDNDTVDSNADDEIGSDTEPMGAVFVDLVLALGIFDASEVELYFEYSSHFYAPGPTARTEDDLDVYDDPSEDNYPRFRVWTKAEFTERDKKYITDTDAGDLVPADTWFGASILSSESDGTYKFYIEGVGVSPSENGEDAELVVKAKQDDVECEDTVCFTIIRADVDVDTDNDDDFDEPERDAREDNYEDIENAARHPGKIVWVNDNDNDEDELVDFADGYNALEVVFGIETNIDDQTEGEQFYPIVFELSKAIDVEKAMVELDYDESDPLGIYTNERGSIIPADGCLRMWTEDGDVERDGRSTMSGGHFVTSGVYSAEDFGFSSDQRVVTNYIEAVDYSEGVADLRVLFEVDPDGYDEDEESYPPTHIAKDAVRITSLPAPRLLGVTRYFTPRQSESPPYHVCKVDYKVPRELTPEVILHTKHEDKDWTADGPFYEASFPDPVDDRVAYELETTYDVEHLYELENSERICWDGRKRSDMSSGDDIDTMRIGSEDYEVWARRPKTINSEDEGYDVRLKISYTCADIEITCTLDHVGGGDPDLEYTNTASSFSVELSTAEGDPAETLTCPMQQEEEKQGIMGPAPHFGFYSEGDVNSHTMSLFLDGPWIDVKSDGRPVPDFNCYFNGNHWRHTPMKFGWTHTYEMRMLPVYVEGETSLDDDERRLYLLDKGDHCFGPFDPVDGSDTEYTCWMYGKRFDIEETDIDKEWVVKMPDANWLVYSFGEDGHLTNVVDNNDNELTVILEEYPTDLLIQKVKSVEGGGVGLEFTYTGDDEEELKSMECGEFRGMSFEYYDTNDEYAVEYPADEVMKEIVGSEYTNTFEYADGQRTNRASRIIIGAMTNRVVGAIQFNYTFEPEEDVNTLPSEAEVSKTSLGDPDEGDLWRQRSYSGKETYTSGEEETHSYAGNKLQTIEITKGGDTAEYAFDYKAGRGYRQRRSSPNGDITYVYDEGTYISGEEVGNLTTVNYPATDYGVVHHFYDGDNFREKTIIGDIGSEFRETEYEPDGNRNINKVIQKNDPGATPAERTWVYTWDPSSGNLTDLDDSKSSSSFAYNGNRLGLPTKVTRTGSVDNKSIDTLVREYDTIGNITLDADREGNATKYEHDGWDRVTKTTYANGDFATREYRPLNDLEKETAPAGGAPMALETTYEFDDAGKPEGKKLKGTEVDHEVDYTGVDDEGRPTEIKISGDGKTYMRSYQLDYAGRTKEETRGGVRVGGWTYDGFGNTLTFTDGEGNTHEYEYYSDSALRVYTRPGGLGFTKYTRDDARNLIAIKDNPGAGFDTLERNMFHDYNWWNQRTKTKDWRGKEWVFTPDVLDNVECVTDPLGRLTRREYDGRELCHKVTLPAGTSLQNVLPQDRSDNGFVESTGDVLDNSWSFGHDSLNRYDARTPPAGGGPGVDHTISFYGLPLQTKVGGMDFSRKVDAYSQTTERGAPRGAYTFEYEPAGMLSATDRKSMTTALDRNGSGFEEMRTHNSGGGRPIETKLNPDGVGLPGRPGIGANEAPARTQTPRERQLSRDGMLNVTEAQATKSGAVFSRRINGFGWVERYSDPHVGVIEYAYDPDGFVKTVSANGRRPTVVTVRDDVGNPKEIDGPLGTLTQNFNAWNMLKSRSIPAGAGSRAETFGYSIDAGKLKVDHDLGNDLGKHCTDVTIDAAGRFAGIANEAMTRNLSYDENTGGVLACDAIGGGNATYGRDAEGRINSVTLSTGDSFDLDLDDEGRIEKVWRGGGGGLLYEYKYDDAGILEEVKDHRAGLPVSPMVIPLKTDAVGHTWEETLPEGVVLELPVNDISTVTGSVFDSETIVYNIPDNVRPTVADRPGNVPDSSWAYNGALEMTEASHGGMCGVSLTRAADTGYITGREVTLASPGSSATPAVFSDTFSHNNLGWIESESRSGWEASYAYRPVGDAIRDTYTFNGRTATFETGAAGYVKQVDNAVLGAKTRVPCEGYIVDVPCDAATVADAYASLVADFGGSRLTEPVTIRLAEGDYVDDIDLGLSGGFSDDFDSGGAGAWSVDVAGAGSVEFQAGTRVGDSGYAPLFSAGDTEVACLRHTLVPAVVGTQRNSFHFHPVSTDIDAAGEEATLFRLSTLAGDPLVEFRMGWDGANRVMRGYYSDGGSLTSSAAEPVVGMGAWFKVVFDYDPDLARFRWWLNGQEQETVDGVVPPAAPDCGEIALGIVEASGCAAELAIDLLGRGALHATPWCPLVVRSGVDQVVRLKGKCTVHHQDNLWLQGVRLEHTASADAVTFRGGNGPCLASCVVLADVTFEGCIEARVLGNTFDYAQPETSGNELLLEGARYAVVANNIFLHTVGDHGWSCSDCSPVCGSNLYHPGPARGGEVDALEGDPLLDAANYFITDAASPAYRSGSPLTAAENRYWDGVSRKVTDDVAIDNGTSGSRGAIFFNDANGDGSYDFDEDVWHDSADDGVWNPGSDTVISDGADALWTTDPGTVGCDEGVFYEDADESGGWGSGEGAWVNPGPVPTADLNGWIRDFYAPCRGAVERMFEKTVLDPTGTGRIIRREVQGRVYDYEYDALGRLTGFSDSCDPLNNAEYRYDHMGRRIQISVGNSVTRCVYRGHNCVAEYHDADDSGAYDDNPDDYKRVYWFQPNIDHCIGFVHIDSTAGREPYYYLRDQVGSVMQVVRDNGAGGHDVVNQYDYDAFGNIRWQNSFEGIPNRYTFHGREWDANAGHYYYRYRTYIPEWGSFTGPDLNLRNGLYGEPNGHANYVFCENDPLNNVDPLGLAETHVGHVLEKTNPLYYNELSSRRAADVAARRAAESESRFMATMHMWSSYTANFNAEILHSLQIQNMVEGFGGTMGQRVATDEIEYDRSTWDATKNALNLAALDVNPMGQIFVGVGGESLEPWNPGERMAGWERASRVSGGVGGTAGFCALGLSVFGPKPAPAAVPTGVEDDLVAITHRGTPQSIASKVSQGKLPANPPRPNNALTRLLDHPKPAVWVSEGQPTLWNRLWSGMVGRRGSASVTFKVSRSMVKRPGGWLKRWFGKSQRVIEHDVPIPPDATIHTPPGGG